MLMHPENRPNAMAVTRDWRGFGAGPESKWFFFEKKNQKTFHCKALR
jgi:hypothetical protein